MSLQKLQGRDLLPHEFKYVGFFVSGLCVVYGLIYHIVESNLLFEGLHAPNMIFTLGLIIVIMSRETFEDERIKQIRGFAHSWLSALFVGYIFLEELDGTAESMISELSAFLTSYIIIFHLIYYFDSKWITKNPVKVWFAALGILLTLIYSYKVLWSA